MSLVWALPWLLQGLIIGVDDVWFHRRRKLPLWERVGHPIDTLTVVACLALPFLVNYGPLTSKIYVVLALISCLMITKDEWVHAKHCKPAEHWLHAVLFVLHPIVLIAAWVLWLLMENRPEVQALEISAGTARSILGIELAVTGGFAGYQVLSGLIRR